jgi:hypothetical protein
MKVKDGFIEIESIGSFVKNSGFIYPAKNTGRVSDPDLENESNLTDPELNCEVYFGLSVLERMIVEEHIGNDIFTLFKENALKNCPKRK